MEKDEALKLIDAHKNKLINPVEMLHWTWLRVTILQIPDAQWQEYSAEAAVVLSK